MIKQRKNPAKGKGIALIVALIILVLMTILSISAVRMITAEEKMATNSYDRSLAFQAVESALKTVEALVETEKPEPTTGCAVVGSIMVCATPLSNSTPRWLDTTFTSWQNSDVVGSGNLAVTPQYFVEYLGNTFACRPGDASDPNSCKRYRVTARTDGTGGRATVMLQSIYATD
jgi:type IV pilus assembly protein PilX